MPLHRADRLSLTPHGLLRGPLRDFGRSFGHDCGHSCRRTSSHGLSPRSSLRGPRGSTRNPCRGFSLTELAIAMLIIGLLAGTALPGVSTLLMQRRYDETTRTLHEAREALLGFAALQSATDGRPRLPCPDSDGDGREDRNGNGCRADEGDLPWADLGAGRTDAWNNRLRYRVDPVFSNSAKGFTLRSEGRLQVCADAACTRSLANALPLVLVSFGRNGSAGGPPGRAGADEAANADGDGRFVSHTHSPDFDDLVTWIPTTLLCGRMIAAGRLP